jgi:hypothetical protein
MENDDKSRNFVRQHTNISYLAHHIEEGREINTMQQRVMNISETIQKALEELTILRNLLDMATIGTNQQEPPTLLKLSIPRNNSITSNFSSMERMEEGYKQKSIPKNLKEIRESPESLEMKLEEITSPTFQAMNRAVPFLGTQAQTQTQNFDPIEIEMAELPKNRSYHKKEEF